MSDHKMASSQTEVERAIVTIVKCFFDHAGEEGKKETLSISEFVSLSSKELPHLMKDVSLEEKMKELDINQDNELKFNEYWRLMGELSKQIKKEIKPKK
ncbi:protein S100-A13-like isoform X1 [Bufo bufo]|uniref:protein S100-A13-like isoform X1 n=2 Tax=Bufo bufo TaxID=8384 RepID=UPI001ABD9DEC|nr:protein S100-A13-like isoform X1 [Bufo bufo]